MAKRPDKPGNRSRRDLKAKPGDAAMQEAADRVSDKAIPVVGIGASAGGIEALSSFFDAMPADSGCAFVVVLHLDPKRESEMARILRAHTKMPVAQVEDGMQLLSDHVYVIAPATEIKLSGGRLEAVSYTHLTLPTIYSV